LEGGNFKTTCDNDKNVNHPEIPRLIEFSQLKLILEAERKAILRVDTFSEESDTLRSVADAEKILATLEQVQSNLHKCFSAHPSLMALFNQAWGNFHEFLSRERILELCFYEQTLFHQKEQTTYVQFQVENEGESVALPLNDELLKKLEKQLIEWGDKAVIDHSLTLNNLKQNFTSETKSKDLPCQCNICVGEYRTKFREAILNECLELIKTSHEDLTTALESNSTSLGEIFKNLQKNLDKKFFSVRFKLKRSVISRLESQVKERVRAHFCYPSELAKKHAENLKPWFQELLRNQGLKKELISDEEYNRFYTLLSTNIWRGQVYLEAEFSKLVKSLLALKRKDISAKILKEYLGEFWIHSRARRINRKIIYHMGPTNSGKTYHAIQALAAAKKGCYLAPLRLLAGELYDTLNEKGVATTLLTGEEVIETEGATHYSSTIEMARLQEDFDCCVIDEIQMISDPQRGWAWTRALVNIFAPEIHICGDPSVLDLIKQIVALCGDTLEVKQYNRMCELKLAPSPMRLGDLEKHDALIVFSRKNALKYKSEIERLGFKVSIVYGRLSPEVRREQARKFDEGETDVIVSTDAIAMGMNLPIKRIVFSTLTKHIDDESFAISPSEIKQIAGRAGRFNRFPVGVVNCLTKVENGLMQVKNAIEMTLEQKTQCMVGPDLDIFSQVNRALHVNSLPELTLSEFLRLFNTMSFQRPFFCVDLKEMIELAEMVEEADFNKALTSSEIFGFACAPVNLGLMEHVQYYVWILNTFVKSLNVDYEPVDYDSGDIDYLETSIKCVELYQWLARHFNYKFFDYDEISLQENKSKAIERLNELLSEKIVRTCASCGVVLPESVQFGICEACFADRRSRYRSAPRSHNQGQAKMPQNYQTRRNQPSHNGRNEDQQGRPPRQGDSNFSRPGTKKFSRPKFGRPGQGQGKERKEGQAKTGSGGSGRPGFKKENKNKFGAGKGKFKSSRRPR